MTTTQQQNLTTGKIAVSIHAEDPIVAAGIATLLRKLPAVTMADTGHGQRSQVGIVAVGLSGLNGIESFRAQVARRHVPVVLVAGALAEADLEALSRRVSVSAVVPLWMASRSALHVAIVEAATHRRSLTATAIGALLGGAGRPDGAFEPPLDIREIAVLKLVADGHTSVDVAERLGYSVRTTNSIVSGITNRPGIYNRTHAVASAIRDGLL